MNTAQQYWRMYGIYTTQSDGMNHYLLLLLLLLRLSLPTAVVDAAGSPRMRRR